MIADAYALLSASELGQNLPQFRQYDHKKQKQKTYKNDEKMVSNSNLNFRRVTAVYWCLFEFLCLVFLVSVLLSTYNKRVEVSHMRYFYIFTLSDLQETPTVGEQKITNIRNILFLKKIPHTGDKASLDRCG